MIVARVNIAGAIAAAGARRIRRETLHDRAVGIDRDENVGLSIYREVIGSPGDELKLTVAVDVFCRERTHLIAPLERKPG